MIKVYTDGACTKNGSPDNFGGAGAIIITPGGKEITLSKGFRGVTNQQMELRACILALDYISENFSTFDGVRLFTDSKYIYNCFRYRWSDWWRRNGWLTKAGSPVKNQELWAELISLQAITKCDFRWVKGHSGDPLNEKADELARVGIEFVKKYGVKDGRDTQHN